MGKELYVEATAVGYYGGKRVPGSKFWLVDGEAEFSKKWMKKLDPSQAIEAAPQSIDGGLAAEQKIAVLTKSVETAEKERQIAQNKIVAAEKERDDAKAEAAKFKFDLESIRSERDHLNAELQAATKLIKNADVNAEASDKVDNSKKS